MLHALAIGWGAALRPNELRVWLYLAGKADPVTGEYDAGARELQRFLGNAIPTGARSARARLIRRGLLEVIEQPMGPWPMRVRVIVPIWPPPAELASTPKERRRPATPPAPPAIAARSAGPRPTRKHQLSGDPDSPLGTLWDLPPAQFEKEHEDSPATQTSETNKGLRGAKAEPRAVR